MTSRAPNQDPDTLRDELVLELARRGGSSATQAKVDGRNIYEAIAKTLGIPEGWRDERYPTAERGGSQSSKFAIKIQWAKDALKNAGLIETPAALRSRGIKPHGFWVLTARGMDKARALGFAQTAPTPPAAEEHSRTEGGRRVVSRSLPERDPTLRDAAIRLHTKKGRIVCAACRFDFEETYGALGRGFIEMHHVVPLEDGARDSRPSDLIPLCSNCHRMVHRTRGVTLSVDELRDKLSRGQSSRKRRRGS